MISAVTVAEPAKAAAALASVMAAGVGGNKTATDADVATNARHLQITLILLTLTRISPQTSGNILGLCTHMSYSYETAAVVAAEEATRVTKGAAQIEPPTVCPQQIRTQTIPLARQMRRPRTVAVSAVARKIPDLWEQVAHVRCMQ